MSSYRIRQYDDVYLPEVQQALIDKVEDGDVSEVISIMIEINERRANQKYGLWRRIRDKSASKYEWENPKDADGIPIYARPKPGATKVNNKLHTAFDSSIITTNAGYFLGQSPEVVFEEEGDIETLSEINDDLEESADLEQNIMEMGQAAIGRGSGFLIPSKIEGDNDLYITNLHDWNCIILYDQITGVAKYGLVYSIDVSTNFNGEKRQDANSSYIAKWYDGVNVTDYEGSKNSFDSGESKPHMMGTADEPNMPLIEFQNNTERIGDVERTINLQDAYDIANSDLSSEISQLRLAYLAIIGAGEEIDDVFIERLLATGVMALDENGDAKFIEKNLSSEAVETLKSDLKNDIFDYSNSYDPKDIGGSGDTTAFEIAQRLFKLESATAEREKLFTVALKRLYKIIIQYYRDIKSFKVPGGKIKVRFTRNLPKNILNDLELATRASVRLSNRSKIELADLGLNAEEEEQRLLEELESDLNVGVEPMPGAFKGEENDSTEQ